MVLTVDLTRGMVVDLEGDTYANLCPIGDVLGEECTHMDRWEYEYGVVWGIELEDVPPHYPAVVEFTNGEVIAFPRDHGVKVVGVDDDTVREGEGYDGG